MTQASFHDDVLDALTLDLPGQVDDELPHLNVTAVVDVTRFGEVLGVEVAYTADEGQIERRRFVWTEWEPFTDGTAAAVASGMAMLIRVELREAVNSLPPGEGASERFG